MAKEKRKETVTLRDNRTAAKRIREEISRIKVDICSYFTETTVHGFRYIVEGRDNVERICWAIVIVTGFILSALLIQQSFANWENTPLQTTIETVSLPIEKLDFPAITVCNPDSLKMPRRNRWMFLEKLLKWAETKGPNEREGKFFLSNLDNTRLKNHILFV